MLKFLKDIFAQKKYQKLDFSVKILYNNCNLVLKS